MHLNSIWTFQDVEGKPQKKLFLSGLSTKRGGQGLSTSKEKRNFFLMFFFKFVAVENLKLSNLPKQNNNHNQSIIGQDLL